MVRIIEAELSDVANNFEYINIPVWKTYDYSGTYVEVLNEYVNNNLWVYDTDSARTFNYCIGILIGSEYKWYKVVHTFSPEWDDTIPDGEGFYVSNEFEIEEISKPDSMPKDRNWFIPSSISHPESHNWPPQVESLVGFEIKGFFKKINR